MQIVRFRADGKIRYGLLEANYVVEYSGTQFTTFRRGRRRYPLDYRDHAAELGLALPEGPIMFLKPPSALVGPDDPVVHPAA